MVQGMAARMRCWWWVVVGMLAVAALVGAACGGGGGDDATVGEPVGVGTATEDVPSPRRDVADGDIASGPVTLTTIDGVELAADVTVVGDVWVLLGHQFGLDRGTWGALPSALQAAGYSTLLWDFRDHGASPEGDFGLIDVDWQAAVAFAEAHGASRLSGVGASMGGTSGLVAMANGAPLERFVAISSGIHFADLDAGEALERIAAGASAPLLLFVSGDADEGASFGLGEFDRIASELGLAHDTELYETSLHGNRLVESEEFGAVVVERVVGFLSEGAPTLSAGPRYELAYVQRDDDGVRVVLQNPFGDGDPSAVLELSIEPIFTAIPFWHPDGEQVGVAFFDRMSVWSPARGVVEPAEVETPVGLLASFFGAAWSADGSRLVFSVSIADIGQAPLTPALLDFASGSVVAPFAEELSPPVFSGAVWSPDGERLLVEGPGSVVVLDGRTLAVVQTIELPRKSQAPSLRQVDALAWLPDSTKFVAVVEGNEVWRGDAGSGGVERVLTLQGEVNSVRGTPLSPDGERLAWVNLSMVGTSYPLMVTSLVSGDTETVLASAGEDYAEVRWSPDGRYLSATVHPGGPGNFDNVMVVVVDVASGEQTVVGVGSGAEWRP